MFSVQDKVYEQDHMIILDMQKSADSGSVKVVNIMAKSKYRQRD